MARLLFCTFVMIVFLTFIDAGPPEFEDVDALLKDAIISVLNLDGKATAKEVCDALQNTLKVELEIRKKNGGSGVLKPNEADNEWINECKKPNVKKEDVLNVIIESIPKTLEAKRYG